MYPRQIENVANQHVQALRSARRAGGRRAASRRQPRTFRAQAGWTLIAVGLRLASPASR